MLKYLRIAVTTLSLTACVLLVALWVRSYWWMDWVDGPIWGSKGISFSSVPGNVAWSVYDLSPLPSEDREWQIQSQTISDYLAALRGTNFVKHQFRSGFAAQRAYAQAPHWFPILVTGGFAVAPWIQWRFSLRTLLVATTLVAVGLGAIMLLN